MGGLGVPASELEQFVLDCEQFVVVRGDGFEQRLFSLLVLTHHFFQSLDFLLVMLQVINITGRDAFFVANG